MTPLAAIVVAVAASVGVAAFDRRRVRLRLDGGPPTPWTSGLRSTGRRVVRPKGPSTPSAELVEDLARSIRGGATIEQAIGEGATRPGGGAGSLALREVVAAGEAGVPLLDAVRSAVDARTDDPETARMLRLLAVGISGGGRLADLLDQAAAGLRARDALRRDAVAQAAQARASAAVIGLLPVGFVALAWMVAPAVVDLLLRTPLGWACIVVGVGLDGAGIWWMRKLISGVVG